MAVTAQDLVLAISFDPSRTAARWKELCPQPPVLDGDFLYHCYSHHVGGIAYDALGELGWDSLLPPFAVTVLPRGAGLSEAVWEEHRVALAALAERHPDLIRESLLVKGALLGLAYRSKRHRVMGDFDLIIDGDRLGPLLAALESEGYERRSDMAYDLIKQVGPLYTGAGEVAMHVWDLPRGWERHIEDGAVDGIPCKVPSVELHLVELLLNAHEHAASWYYTLWESDLQLVRSLDVELLDEQADGVDPARLWAVAEDLGMQAEIALGLWVHRELRGGLPAGWDALTPVVDAVSPFGNLFALPAAAEGERIRTWHLGVRDRAFHPSRHDLAVEQLPAHLRTPEFLGAIKNGTVSRSQPVSEIAGRARAALAGVRLSGTRA